MRQLPSVLVSSLLALFLAAPATARAQQAGTSAAAAKTVSPTHDGYSSHESDFVVGKRVHLRSTRTFIGTIMAVDESHDFPPKRFPRAKMKAVLIERRDGPMGWVPLEGITRIYVVR